MTFKTCRDVALQRLYSNVSTATSLQQRLYSNVSTATSLQTQNYDNKSLTEQHWNPAHTISR
ncbi:hypothetical protein [Fischerella thermalis]|uniref:hypothetical protein n=1 Tax=Fischerella thermalis TaxID=372787 RepID=UPI000317516C|nr:hypothetical protein [Fischerella thermalis]